MVTLVPDTVTTSTTSNTTFTEYQATDRIDTFLTRLTAHLDGGPLLYDQSFGVPISDPIVQAAILAARQALVNAASPLPVNIVGPTLISSTPSLFDTALSTDQELNHIDTIVTVSLTLGPAPILIGPEQCCTHFVPDGVLNENTNTHSHFYVDETTTTTETWLTSEHHEIVGNPVDPAAIPEPGTVALMAAGLCGLAWMRRRRRSEPA